MLGMGFQEGEVLVSECLNGFRKIPVAGPKLRRGDMLQSSLVFPALCMARALSAGLSSRPA